MTPTTKAGGTVKDVDSGSRTVVAHYSVFGVVDNDGDVVHEGAFEQAIEKDGPEGRDRIWKMRDHDWSQRLGKPDAIYEDGEGLVMETTMPDTTLANDVLAMYEQVGESMEHSVGMMLPEDGTERRKQGEGLDIYQAKLIEGSVVPWGANMYARMQEMKADSELAASNVIPRHIDALKDLLSAGITEERKELFQIQLHQLEAEWKALQQTTREKEKAEEKASDPVNERAKEIAEKATARLEATDTIDTLTERLSQLEA